MEGKGGPAGERSESRRGDPRDEPLVRRKGLIHKARIYHVPAAGRGRARSSVEGMNQPWSLLSGNLCRVQPPHLFSSSPRPRLIIPTKARGKCHFPVPLLLQRRPWLTSAPSPASPGPPFIPTALVDLTPPTYLVFHTRGHYFIPLTHTSKSRRERTINSNTASYVL